MPRPTAHPAKDPVDASPSSPTAYNPTRSQRRADAVKDDLANSGGLGAAKAEAAGTC